MHYAESSRFSESGKSEISPRSEKKAFLWPLCQSEVSEGGTRLRSLWEKQTLKVKLQINHAAP